MKLMPPWLPPVAAALAVVGLVVSIGKWEPRHARADLSGVRSSGSATSEELCEGYPWGTGPNDRIMNVVLENDGVYVGTRRVPYESFRVFMIKNARLWCPDHVAISGVQDCRIGHGAEVFDAVRLLQLCPFFSPFPVPAGTRLPVIELYRDGMTLEEWEQMEKDAAAR
jgi:hypothetical protein